LSKRRARPPIWRWVFALLFVVGLLWTAAALLELWTAKRDADAALRDLRGVRAAATSDVSGFVDALASEADGPLEESTPARLEEAAETLDSAHGTTRSWLVSPYRALPVVGRQIRSFDALASAAATASGEGAEAFETAADSFEQSLDEPRTRVAAVEGLHDALVELQAGVSDLDLGPTDGLIGPLARARDRFALEYAAATATIDHTIVATEGVADFLDGPSTYLLLAANNGEMQAGSPMYLQVGLLRIEGGRFEVDDLVPASDLHLDQPTVPLDPDVAARWGWLRPNQEWRNLNLTPRFDESARMAAGMWNATGGAPVDGVLAVDVVAIEQLLEVTGPVEVDGQMLDSGNIADDLLVDQYVDFEYSRDERRERLGRVVRTAFDALNTRRWSPSVLLRSLQPVGEGRHLLAWTPDERQERAWLATGIDGRVGERSLLLSVLNRGGNKLDPYLVVEASLEITPAERAVGEEPPESTLHQVRVAVTLRNAAPTDLPRYVAGPHPQSPVGEGTYRGILSLTIPGEGGNPVIEGAEPVTVGDDGPTRVLAASVVVERDQTATVVFTFELPGAQRDLLVEPSARLPAVTWIHGEDTWEDQSAVAVSW
jgi:hypothetical protein